MHIDLSGQTALVTGASRGIGRAIARALSASGARVALHYNTQREQAERIAASLDHDPICLQADLSDPVACEALFSDTLRTFGRLDVLVNNAGVAIELPIEAPTDRWLEGWQTTMAVNLQAAELLCRLALRYFKTHEEGGRIINIASRAAFRGDTADYMAYAASKAGVVALTKSIARAFGKDGVAAFVVAPGFTRTDMAQDFIDAYGEAYAVDDIALSRLTEPEDIAPLVTLLASGQANHATGATIDVNAGSYVH